MQENITDDIPPMINNVIGKTCIFEVKVTSFNKDGREAYTVARILEIAESTSTSHDSTPANEAGPSKKHKVT